MLGSRFQFPLLSSTNPIVRMTGMPLLVISRTAFRRYSLSRFLTSSSPGTPVGLLSWKSSTITDAPALAAAAARSARYLRFVGWVPESGGLQNAASSISTGVTHLRRDFQGSRLDRIWWNLSWAVSRNGNVFWMEST